MQFPVRISGVVFEDVAHSSPNLSYVEILEQVKYQPSVATRLMENYVVHLKGQ
jgi:hypothetical protein